MDTPIQKDTPTVSVCCISYNLEDYISEAIESILKQETDFNYELIIHDDASTDRTQQIIKSYAEQYPDKIRTIFQEKNVCSANEGRLGFMFNNYILPETRGEYIALCDGDDYWIDSQKLQKQFDFLKERPDYSACVTNALLLNQMTNEKWKYISNSNGDSFSEFKVVIGGGGLYPTSTLFFDKSKFTSSKFYPHYNDFAKYYQCDTLYTYCLMFTGKIGYLSDCTAVYRRWKGGRYSGIKDEPDKISAIKEREIEGNKKLLKTIDHNRKKLFKRKISVDSLNVIRNKSGVERFKYFVNLGPKEIVKFLINR